MTAIPRASTDEIAAQHMAAMVIAEALRMNAEKQRAQQAMADDDPRAAHIKWAREAIAKAQPKPHELWPEPLTLEQLEAMELPETEWLVKHIVAERSVIAIGAQPKATKTWLGLDLMISIASGTQFLGKFDTCCKPQHVVIFCAEDALVSVRRRIRALCNGRGWTGADYKEIFNRVHIFPRQRIDLCDEETLVRFAAAIHMHVPEGPAAIMLDPLIDVAHIDDENKASEMKNAADKFRILRDIFGASVVFVHHMVKSGGDKQGKGPQRRGGQSLRGSGSLHGAVDGGIYMTDVNETEHSCNVAVETRDGQAAFPFSLKLAIQDDAQGKAFDARWQTDSPDVLALPAGAPERRASKGDQAEELEERIVAHLISVHEQAQRSGIRAPIQTRDTIRVVVKKGSLQVAAALKSLLQKGVVKHTTRDGWGVADT